MKLTLIRCSESRCCGTQGLDTSCTAETKAFKAQSRRKNVAPAGYQWRLWHEWDGPIARAIPTHPIGRYYGGGVKPHGYAWKLWHEHKPRSLRRTA